jgi:surface protein
MFLNSSSFNQPIGSWDVSSVTNMVDMFDNSGVSTENYDNILIGWSSQVLQSNVTFGAEALTYCSGADARQNLIDTYEWVIVDAGLSAPTTQASSAVFETETSSTLNLTSFLAPSGGADAYAIYINDTNSFTAPVDGDEPTGDLSWNDAGQQAIYVGISSSPNITVSDLDPGTQYFFQIYAYNDCSGTKSYETTGLNTTDTTAQVVLTILGLTGDDKVYDGTNAAAATSTETLVGVEPGDDVFLGGAPVFTFASANVGTGITMTTSGYTISGTDSGNYTLTQPTLSGDIKLLNQPPSIHI